MVYEETATRTGQFLKLQYFPLSNKKHGNDNLLITHGFQALSVKFITFISFKLRFKEKLTKFVICN